MEDRSELDRMAIPRLAEEVGVSPRVLRYWEEQGLISPSFERGRLRYSPRDLAIARLVRMVMERTGISVEGVRVLKALAEREVRDAASDEAVLAELALRLLYARKAFREVAGVDEERLGAPPRPEPPPHHGPGGPKAGPKHGPKEHGPKGPEHGPKGGPKQGPKGGPKRGPGHGPGKDPKHPQENDELTGPPREDWEYPDHPGEEPDEQ